MIVTYLKHLNKRITDLESLIVAVVVGFFFVAYSFIGLVKHAQFQTGLDLAVYTQSLYKYATLQVPRVTFYPINGDIVYADHFTPSLSLLAPLYRIAMDARFLLVFQAFIFVSGSLPIYLLARKRLKDFWLSLSVVIAYLTFFGSQYALTFDFHTATITASLLSWLLYFTYTKQYKLILVLAVLISGVKEDAPVYVTTISLILFLQTRKLRWLLLAGITGLYFVWVISVGMPMFRSNFIAPTTQQHLSLAQLNIFQVLFSSPIKVKTLLLSFGSFLFIPLFSGVFLLLPLVHFFINFSIPGLEGRWDIFLHYRIHLAAILSFGFILGYEKLQISFQLFRTKIFKFVVAVFFIAILIGLDYGLHLPMNSLGKSQFYKKDPQLDLVSELVEHTPQGSSVMTMNHLLPYLANRDVVRYFKYSPIKMKEVSDIEYIVLDLRANQPLINYWLSVSQDDLDASVTWLLTNGFYQEYYHNQAGIILERLDTPLFKSARYNLE